jgi:AraC-like DNA-binding protein
MEKKMDYTKVPGSATAYRRQKQIEECLFENLLLRRYPSVSISDLCHQLGISRKSFTTIFRIRTAASGPSSAGKSTPASCV